MISGLAPGSDAETEIVGKSTCGSGETGSSENATTPARATAAVSSVVAIGRLIKGAEAGLVEPAEVGADLGALYADYRAELRR